MSGDSLVFDMSQMTEGSPSVFVKRDWLNIQDQQNGNYGGNQLVIDTSQLANSNKYMAYREAYITMPLTLAVSAPIVTVAAYANTVAVVQDLSGGTVFGPLAAADALSRGYISSQVSIGGTTYTILGMNEEGTYLELDGTIVGGTYAVGSVTIAASQPGLDNYLGDIDAGVGDAPGGEAQTFCVGLKSWFGNMIHSMTLDYAGTTIIQQTPWQSMWSMFGLMTTLSISDIELNASTIGFYPDAAQGWSFQSGDSKSGQGVCNNITAGALHGQIDPLTGTVGGNPGMLARFANTLINPSSVAGGAGGEQFSTLQTAAAMDQLWRSRVFQTYRSEAAAPAQNYTGIVYQIEAIIMLKHLHPFFSQVPLLKGVFFRLTLNLNQPEVVLTMLSGTGAQKIVSITSPLGGISPIIVSSTETALKSNMQTIAEGSSGINQSVSFLPTGAAGFAKTPLTDLTARITLNVGNTIISQTQRNSLTSFSATALDRSCQLYVPAFTFNPSFEEAYLSRPTKSIVYTDIYQFTTTTVNRDGQFNFLLTNGISNVKSVLILPFFPNIRTEGELGTPAGSANSVLYPPYQSPFDPAGTGPVSPMVALRNFNVVVAGQNMIYNTQQYNFEQFLNQLVGVNSVNANLTDGLTSGLVDFMSWQQSYGYYYVNCSRMLPIDEAVPKSISIQGTNMSQSSVQFLCFIEYGVQVSVDVLTGARV